jgi:hypothetical protein
MKTNTPNGRSLSMRTQPAIPTACSVAALMVRWWRGFRHSLCALEFLRARYHRMGWHPELDGDAYAHRVQRLRNCKPI